ncbi:MAG: outer membrane beta-barrel family protein [Bacteroidaceae bacterium]|nr:outer membrane beta-barrel family protein [Bacteroidaceae bacterium]
MFPVSAQNRIPVFGTVQDAVMKRPICQAKVSILTADSVVVMDSVPLNQKTDSKGEVTKAEYTATLKGGKYLFRASLNGYTDAWQKVDLPNEGAGFFMVPALELRRERVVKMNEVEITATRVKMYYRGDTLVYNASDFQLPDGSMLDDLIRQLPGVTLNDAGEIFVHGRKVEELQLGSRSFFRGNSKVLLENLPYYTVRNIKVYEQDTDKNRAVGYAIEKKRFVMDVNLKQDYNRGLIGNLEAAGGTKDRYLGRGFLLGFTDPYRFTLMGNSNNVNEKQHIGQSSSWSPNTRPQSLLTSHSAAGEISYQSADKNTKNDLTAEFASTKDESEMRQRRELFLNGLIPVQNRHDLSTTRANKISVKNRFRKVLPQFYGVDVSYAHNSYTGDASVLSEQFNDTLVTRMREQGMTSGHSWNAQLQADGTSTISKEKEISISYKAGVGHSDDETDKARAYAFDKPVADNQYNTNTYHRKQTTASGCLTLNSRLPKDIFANLYVTYEYDNERTHDYLYHPDTLLLPSQLDALQAITDRSNSYDSHLYGHKVPVWLRLFKRGFLRNRNGDYEYTHDYSVWEMSSMVVPFHRELNYRRGSLDTLAVQRGVDGYVDFSCNLYPKKNYQKHWYFNVSHNFSPASIFDVINYRDDSQPLVVKLGNPNLKSNQRTTAAVSFERRTKEAMNHYRVWFNGGYWQRQTAQSVTYNPQNGQYTYRPVNVSGSYYVYANFNITHALDKKKRWTWETTANARLNHYVDHALMEGMTASQENVVNNLTLNEKTYVQYSKGKLNLRAEANAMWVHSESCMHGFSTLNAVDYNYGVKGRYTLPFGLTVATDLKMYSRRGYGSASMNADDLVWNASLSQSFLKGRLVAGLEAFDLLHRLSNTKYVVNAQGRVETWNRSLPNYVMLHLQWMFNKNPKKE